MFSGRRGSVSARFRREEVALLGNLLRGHLNQLEDPSPGPVMERLFPAASIDDPLVAGEFHDLVHEDLVSHKLRAAGAALGSLPDNGGWHGRIDPEAVDAWLTVLTDLRLALGTRIGVTEEMMEADFDPQTQWDLAVLHYLGALQESLVQAVGG